MAKLRAGFSAFLHQRRLALGEKWKDILRDAYLSRATLHRIRHGNPHQPIAEVDSLRALAHALKFDGWAELVEAYDHGDPRGGISQRPSLAEPGAVIESGVVNAAGGDAVVALSRALNLTPTELVKRLAGGGYQWGKGELPSGIRIADMRAARMAPHFTSGVAASKRVEKLEEEDHESRRPVDADDVRIFTIPVDGDCQEPVWKNGDIVVFSFDAFDREGILPGKSYYLAFTDGSTTFKRLFVDEQDTDFYVLRCWNATKYPAERRVHFNEVVRIARAISKQSTPEE